MNNHPDWWDPYSCQPYKLQEADKPRTSPAQVWEYLKVAATALAVSPALLLRYLTLSTGTPPDMRDFAGLSISTDKEWRSAQHELVEELGVRHLLVRVPGWQLSGLDSIASYLDQFKEQTFLVNILQSRESVENPDAWQSNVRTIFETLGPRVETFQIANAVNRTKWGCRHSGEALELFRRADLARGGLTNVKILTSSVIDFEPLVTQRTLVNFAGYRSDGCAAELYINRRGSCEGKQYGIFDLQRKIKLLRSMLSISNNTAKKFWITETNWPLLDTKPYTPNSGNPRSTVDEATQAVYLKDYYEIARLTGWVERVYWWQLINPGYGLVDHRDGTLRKMPSWDAFRDILSAKTS